MKHLSMPRGKALIGGAALVILGLTACSDRPDSSRQIFTAPHRADQVGTVVEGASLSDVNSLLEQYPESKFRIVSEKYNIYEVYGLDDDTIKREVPFAEVNKNIYRESLGNRETPPSPFGKTDGTAEPVQGSDDDGVVKDCVFDSEAPYINVKFKTQPPTLRNDTIDLGDEFTLTLKDSQPNPNHPSDLKKSWYIRPPRGSFLDPMVVPGGEISLHPDALGAYYIEMVVQDSRGVCATNQMQIMVTTNVKYQPPTHSRDELQSLMSLDKFWHLDKLNTREAWKLSTGKGVVIAVLDTGVDYNHR